MTNRDYLEARRMEMPDEEYAGRLCATIRVCDECPGYLSPGRGCIKKLMAWLSMERGEED